MIEPNGEDSIAGFTLLEMIVAFLVLSISMAVAVQTVSIASRSIATANEKSRVVDLVANLKAAELPRMLRANEMSADGADKQLRWTIAISSLAPQTSDVVSGLARIKIYPDAKTDRHHEFVVFASGRERAE